ncbi:MAG: hypothetical protein KKC85_19270 [Gammaproteobacteria bacterium]|nr:hypothetical protein [Gammaproteobacteria bacterium]
MGLLGGCDRLATLWTSPAERIELAFPVPDEVSLSFKRLLEASASDDLGARAAERQYEKLRQVRALTCTASMSVGRFDTSTEIKSKVADPKCFGEQNELLAEWVGLRRVAASMKLPPIVPLEQLPPTRALPSVGETTVGITTSAASNVAVLTSAQQKLTAIRLPDGQPIQTFSAGVYAHTGLELSPNGRIFAIPHGYNRGMSFFDVESGAKIWTSSKYLRLITWLPELEGLVMTRSAQGQEAVLIDALTGKSAPYPIAEKRPTWSAIVPGAPHKRLIGGSSSVSIVDHERDGNGVLLAVPADHRRLAKPVTSSAPMLMNNGRTIVYVTMTSLAWADLETGDQGYWDTAALRGNGYAKLDETHVYFAASELGAFRQQGKVLDINQATIASDLKFQHNDGLILPMTPRSGFMRRGESALIGSAVETGPPEDLQKAIASAQLETQLAKLRAAAQAQERQINGLQTAMPAPPVAQALLDQVPANAEVAVLGVYESKAGSHGLGRTRSAGFVRVTVTPASKPLVLVLTSYEPVRWIINNSGRKISAILISGYYDSSALGITNVPVLKIGSSYAYKMDSPEYTRLKSDIARYVSNPVRSFQGTYSGQEFSVPSF